MKFINRIGNEESRIELHKTNRYSMLTVEEYIHSIYTELGMSIIEINCRNHDYSRIGIVRRIISHNFIFT